MENVSMSLVSHSLKNITNFFRKLVQEHYLILLVLLGFLLGTVIGLDRLPLSWHDEAMYSALGCLAVYNSVIGEKLYGDSNALRAYPGLGSYFIGYTYKLFGFGIWQHRIPVVLAATLVVILTYVLALSLGTGPPWAAFAAMLVAGQDYFHAFARTGRAVDMYALLFGLAGFALVLCLSRREYSRRMKFLLLTVSGSLGGLAVGCHPLGIPVILMSVAILLTEEKPIKLKLLDLFTFSLLPVIVVGVWCLWRRFCLGTFFPPERDSFPPLFPLNKEIVLELVRHFRFHLRQPAVLFCWIIGIIGLYLFKPVGKPLRNGLVLGMFAMMFFFYIGVRRTGYDYLYVTAPLGSLIAVLGMHQWPRYLRGKLKWIFFGSMALAVINMAAVWGFRIAVVLHQWDARDPKAWSTALYRYIPSANYVLASGECWWALAERGIPMRLYGHLLSKRERTFKDYDYIIINNDDFATYWPMYVRTQSQTSYLKRYFVYIGEISRPLPPFRLGGHRRAYSCKIYKRREGDNTAYETDVSKGRTEKVGSDRKNLESGP